jgi:SAM-dependent methyltransferase
VPQAQAQAQGHLPGSYADSTVGTAISSDGSDPSGSQPSVTPTPSALGRPPGSRGVTGDLEPAGEIEEDEAQPPPQRERMLAAARLHNPGSSQHHHSAEAAPVLERYNSGTSALSDPSQSSSLTIRSARPPTTPTTATTAATTATAAAAGGGPLQRRPSHNSAVASYVDRRALQYATMGPDSGGGGLGRFASYGNATKDFVRAESLSSTHTSVSRSTMMSSEHQSGSDASSASSLRPFLVRNGRTYLSDPSIPYPLPVDLHELNRQSLRTLLLFQLFGGPVCSPAFATKPPTRVLEVGCGSGFWSMMCHRYYARHGHSSISFTGIDVAPIPIGSDLASSSSGSSRNSAQDIGNRASTLSTASTIVGDGRPDKDMKWRFVQHDLRRMPFPFPDGDFDLVMVKDMSLASPTNKQQELMDEYIRLLRPGGTLEIWESDHAIRMLRPHVPEPPPSAAAGGEDDDDEQEMAASIGAYVITRNTPLSTPVNHFLVEYNGWLRQALEARNLNPMPCTEVGSLLAQEAESLGGLGSRRLAVPLSEVRWEREGVGGVVTSDSSGAGKGKEADSGKASPRRNLTAGQAALRRTALLTVAQMVQGLEGPLREASGKSLDEWDSWLGKMMSDLIRDGGASWGECLEVGAWWARKRKV